MLKAAKYVIQKIAIAYRKNKESPPSPLGSFLKRNINKKEMIK
jgi:hypothetical protein